jgi:methyl-accepting chemotaxis protein
MNRAKKGKRYTSLATRFLLILIVGTVVPLGALGAFQIVSSFITQSTHARDLQGKAAENAAATIDAYLAQMEDEMVLAARAWTLQADESRNAALETLLAHNVGFDALTLTDKVGREVAKVSRYALIVSGDLGDRAESPDFLTAQQGERYLGPVSFSEFGEPFVTLAIPIEDRYGQVAGVFSAEVNLKYMWDLVARIEIGSTGYAYVVDNAGRLIAHRDSSLVLQRQDESEIKGVHYALLGQDVTGSYAGLEGQDVIGNYHALQQAGWFVLAETPNREALADVYQTMTIGAATIAAALVLAALLGWYMTRIVVRPLGRLQEGAAIIGGGDLTHRIDIQTRDEVGSLANAFNAMAAQLRELIDSLEQRNELLRATVQRYDEHMAGVGKGDLASRLSLDGDGQETDDPLVRLGHRLNETTGALQAMIVRIREAAGALSAQAAEILATTTQQASGATEQSAAVSQATTTVDEIRTIADQSVSRSQTVADMAQRTVDVSRAGQELVQETISGMSQIKTRVDVIEENILALSERTNQIGEIIDSVNQIASQSNMLALNAAVEAARAGDQGKGFAVVAEEVRDLAERSTQATAQVKAILSDIQKATNATGMATEEGKKGVDAGVQLVGQMGEAITQLSQVIDESAQSAAQMVAGGRQQTTGMEQVALSMQNINQVTVQTMASTRQAEKSAQELNDLARSLSEIVEQYQV